MIPTFFDAYIVRTFTGLLLSGGGGRGRKKGFLYITTTRRYSQYFSAIERSISGYFYYLYSFLLWRISIKMQKIPCYFMKLK